MLKLMDLSFTIQYKKGCTNAAADALSRYPEMSFAPVAAVSIATPTWLEKLKEGYEEDEVAKELLQELILSGST